MYNSLIILGLILGNGFFAIAEISIISSKVQRLQALAEDGNLNALKALCLSRKPNKVLATAQIGLTLLTLVEGAVTNSLLAPLLSPILAQYNYLAAFASYISILLSFILVTSLTILFGDIIPKRIALAYPEALAVNLSPIINRVVWVFSPLVTIFSYFSDNILRVFGVPIERNTKVSAEDIEDLFEAGAKSGLLDQTEKGLLDNVWRMDERHVSALMTPRADIVYIDIMSSDQDNLKIVLDNPSKRIIVCNEGLDHVLGAVKAAVWLKDVVNQLYSGTDKPKIPWSDNLAPIHGIPNSLSLIETLESLREHKAHMALVYNEFGHVDGLISMSDLMSAVVGESPETTDENLLILKDSSGKWLIDGLAPIDDVKNALQIDELPEGLGSYHTAAGFALAMLGRMKGRLPKEFDSFKYAGYVFEIVDIDRSQGYRIDQLMVQPEPVPVVNEVKTE